LQAHRDAAKLITQAEEKAQDLLAGKAESKGKKKQQRLFVKQNRKQQPLQRLQRKKIIQPIEDIMQKFRPKSGKNIMADIDTHTEQTKNNVENNVTKKKDADSAVNAKVHNRNKPKPR